MAVLQVTGEIRERITKHLLTMIELQRNSRRARKTVSLFFTILPACLLIQVVHAEESLQVLERLSSSNLVAESLATRLSAKHYLLQIREEVARHLQKELLRLVKQPDRSFQSPLHLTVETLGVWRIEEALPSLLAIIDYELDPKSVPSGDKLPRSAFFPAAQAIVEIAGPSLPAILLEKLTSEDRERVIRMNLWVMMKVFGQQESQALLDGNLARAESITVKSKLESAKKMLSMGELLLVFDRTEKGVR